MIKRLLFFLLLFCLPLRAQYGNTVIFPLAGVPAGACNFNQFTTDTVGGNLYFCNAFTHAWVMVLGGTGTTATWMSAPNFCLDAGANDTYACNLAPAIASYVTGTHYWFKANTINTGPASINFNGKGALTIKKLTAGVLTTDLADGDIRAGQWVEGVYDGTNFIMWSPANNFRPPSEGGTGANNTATNTYFLKGNGTNFVTSAGAASGVGTCTNQFPRTLNSDAAPTCASIAIADLPIITTAKGGTGADLSAAGAGTYPKANGATPNVYGASTLAASGIGSCTNQFARALNGDAAPTCASVVSADLNITATTCTNQFVSAISAGVAGTCTTSTLSSAQFANQGTTTTVLHGNGAGNPAFGAVNLAADVTGILPSANLDCLDPLDTTCVTIREDWTSRNDDASYSGSYTWTVGNIAGGATGSAVSGVWPNLGLKRLTTAAAAGDGGLLHFTGQANALGAMGSNAGWDSIWTFRINQTTATRLRVGFAAETATLTPVEGFYVRYDTNATYADTEWQLCARTAAGAETCYDTDIAVDTNFHKIRLRSILAGKVGFTLDAGTEKTICAAGGSCDVSYTITTADLQPSFFIGTDTTATKSADADFFAFKAKGLTR